MLGTHRDQRRTRAGSFDRFIPVRDSLGLAAASFKISGSPRRRDDGAATSPQDVFCEIVGQADGDASNIDSPSKRCRESPGHYRQRMSLLTEMDTEDNVLSFRPRQRSGSWSACVYGDPESTKLPCRQLQSSPVRTLDVAGVNGTNGDFSQLFDINRQGQLALPGGDAAVHIHEITRSHLKLQHYSLHIFKLEPNGQGETRHHRRRYWCVQWSPRGGTLAVGGPDLMLIDVQLGDVTASITPPSLLSRLDWSRHCLSAGFLDGAVCAYDTRAGLTTVGCFTGSSRPSAVTALRYSTDGGLLACGTADGKLVIWDARQRAKPQHEMEAHSDGVGAIAWCPWRPWYITTGGKASDQTIRLWNVYTGIMNKNIMVGSEVTSLAWCEQSSELVSSHGNQSGEANIRVWKSPKMHLVGEMKRHEGPVWQVGLTPEGSKLVSVGSDEILCLWDFWNHGSSMSSHGVSSYSRRRAFTSPGKSPGLTVASPLALGGIR